MNLFQKIEKKLILWFVNSFLSGTHFFKLKRILLNCCLGCEIGLDTKVVAPIYIPIQSVFYVGKNSWIGHDFSIEGNGNVFIGDNCDIAPKCSCITGSHAIGSAERRAGRGFNGDIHIGDGCWIGASVLILPDKTISNSVIVGARGVVTKNLDSHCIYAGNPAKLVKKLEK